MNKTPQIKELRRFRQAAEVLCGIIALIAVAPHAKGKGGINPEKSEACFSTLSEGISILDFAPNIETLVPGLDGRFLFWRQNRLSPSQDAVKAARIHDVFCIIDSMWGCFKDKALGERIIISPQLRPTTDIVCGSFAAIFNVGHDYKRLRVDVSVPIGFSPHVGAQLALGSFARNTRLAQSHQCQWNGDKDQKPRKYCNSHIRDVDIAYKLLMQPFIWIFVGLVCAICGYFIQAVGAYKIEDRRLFTGSVLSIVGILMFSGAPLLAIFGWLRWGWGLL